MKYDILDVDEAFVRAERYIRLKDNNLLKKLSGTVALVNSTPS